LIDQLLLTALKLLLDAPDRLQHPLFRRHEQASRANSDGIEFFKRSPAPRVDSAKFFDLIPEEGNAVGIIRIGQENVHRIALYPEGASPEFRRGAGVQ